MNLLILGPQGSGKGTQGELLSAKLMLPTVSAGALYRDNIKRQTKLGKLALKFTNKGVLGPDKLTNDMMKAELTKLKYKKGVILDGYPRRMAQAKFLDKLLTLDKAILVDISPRETIKRLSGRRVCRACGETFHVLTNKPKKPNRCDKCQDLLIQRSDDYPAAIKKRLAVYNKETRPILDYYKKQGKLIVISGEQSIEKVFKDISQALRNSPKK